MYLTDNQHPAHLKRTCTQKGRIIVSGAACFALLCGYIDAQNHPADYVSCPKLRVRATRALTGSLGGLPNVLVLLFHVVTPSLLFLALQEK